jgi:anti-sigma factor RsiW
MTCREFIDFLDDFLSDALPADRRAAFDRHLSACRDCRNYIESYKQTVRLGKSAFVEPEQDLPAGIPEGLVKAVLAAGVPSRSTSE